MARLVVYQKGTNAFLFFFLFFFFFFLLFFVINFHPRYIFRPPTVVINFIRETSDEPLPDLSCCMSRRYKDRIKANKLRRIDKGSN